MGKATRRPRVDETYIGNTGVVSASAERMGEGVCEGRTAANFEGMQRPRRKGRSGIEGADQTTNDRVAPLLIEREGEGRQRKGNGLPRKGKLATSEGNTRGSGRVGWETGESAEGTGPMRPLTTI